MCVCVACVVSHSHRFQNGTKHERISVTDRHHHHHFHHHLHLHRPIHFLKSNEVIVSYHRYIIIRIPPETKRKRLNKQSPQDKHFLGKIAQQA